MASAGSWGPQLATLVQYLQLQTVTLATAYSQSCNVCKCFLMHWYISHITDTFSCAAKTLALRSVLNISVYGWYNSWILVTVAAGQTNLEGVKAVLWRIEHEADAITQYEVQTGNGVEPCGLTRVSNGLVVDGVFVPPMMIYPRAYVRLWSLYR